MNREFFVFPLCCFLHRTGTDRRCPTFFQWHVTGVWRQLARGVVLRVRTSGRVVGWRVPTCGLPHTSSKSDPDPVRVAPMCSHRMKRGAQALHSDGHTGAQQYLPKHAIAVLGTARLGTVLSPPGLSMGTLTTGRDAVPPRPPSPSIPSLPSQPDPTLHHPFSAPVPSRHFSHGEEANSAQPPQTQTPHPSSIPMPQRPPRQRARQGKGWGYGRGWGSALTLCLALPSASEPHARPARPALCCALEQDPGPNAQVFQRSWGEGAPPPGHQE